MPEEHQNRGESVFQKTAGSWMGKEGGSIWGAPRFCWGGYQSDRAATVAGDSLEIVASSCRRYECSGALKFWMESSLRLLSTVVLIRAVGFIPS